MSKELKTGIVVVVILILSFWGFNFLKGENLLEANSRRFYVEYKNIQGLKKTSPVSISGLEVGKVVDIKINTEEGKKGQLTVEILLDNDFPFSKNSIAKIYSSSLLGGQSLAIIPSYDGEIAESGDYLKGEVESDVFSTVGEKLNPLQAKLESVIVRADSLLLGVNQVLTTNTRESLNRSVLNLENTITDVRKTLNSVNSILESSKSNLSTTLTNAKQITDNFVQLSDSLANTNIGVLVKKTEGTLTSVNKLLAGIEQGNGSLGKLVNDSAMYDNLENASKELEELLREMKLNPKRFVHFSLFGKKAKPYNQENNQENTSNK